MINIDFHIHSKYSFDCFLEPSRIIETARRFGLSGLALTDHDTIEGVGEFRQLAPDLLIIAGEEVTTEDGDILGLFLSEEIAASRKTDAVVRDIRAQGGLAVLAHPYKWPHVVRDPGIFKKFDAIEVFNARNNIPVPYFENLLARRAVSRYGLACVAGSDTHDGCELGLAATRFDLDLAGATQSSLKEAILQKKVDVWGREVFLPREIVSHFFRNIKSWACHK